MVLKYQPLIFNTKKKQNKIKGKIFTFEINEQNIFPPFSMIDYEPCETCTCLVWWIENCSKFKETWSHSC